MPTYPQAERLLNDAGVFIIISYGNPEQRLPFLEQHDIDVPRYTPWTVEVQALCKLISVRCKLFRTSSHLFLHDMLWNSKTKRVSRRGAGLRGPQLVLLCVHHLEARGHGAEEEREAGQAEPQAAQVAAARAPQGTQPQAHIKSIYIAAMLCLFVYR